MISASISSKSMPARDRFEAGSRTDSSRRPPAPPGGGVVASPRLVRGFRWQTDGELVCAPLRCRKEQWYFMRCRPRPDARIGCTEIHVCFQSAGEPIGKRRILLQPIAGDGPVTDLYGWFETPEDATHFSLRIAAGESTGLFDHIGVFPTNERAAISHPAANIPLRSYRPPDTARRVWLPSSLESIAGDLAGQEIEIKSIPRSSKALIGLVRGSTWVLDPKWVSRLRLGWDDLERAASVSCMIVDLDTVATLLARDRSLKIAVKRRKSDRELPCAKVVYADATTRGFALHDVIPYATIEPDGGFATRTMNGDRTWREYADQSGFAPLLSYAQSANDDRPDLLSAAMPVGSGELIASDLPWLVAGMHGPLVAPRLARHLLRMHLGGPFEDHLQYWAPTREPHVLLREIAEMQRHFPALRPLRWSTGDEGIMHLGLSLENGAVNGSSRHVVIQTGRIDHHPGATSLPAEAMMCFMKHLAAEARDATDWSRRNLAGLNVTWQFDSAADRQFRHVFASAQAVHTAAHTAPRVVCLVDEELGRVPESMIDGAKLLRIDVRHGVLGDGSIEYQRVLSRLLFRELRASG
ncbi:MAG: hypothetical protein IID33_01260 [Planctomycetes bacterium]|nr:hypothetical protein [Planctomycetota bacterium]